VVGPNGVGKSTFLRILAGELKPDSGTAELVPPTASVGYLTQEADRRAGETVLGYLRRVTGTAEAEEGLQRAADALARGAEYVSGNPRGDHPPPASPKPASCC
jgi:ATPase subunit of ABC transporter with duplicated ATPase domains